MLSIDTNLLISAIDRKHSFHQVSKQTLDKLLSGKEQIGLTSAVLHEFMSVVTKPNRVEKPLSIKQAVKIVEHWLAAPNVSLIVEQADHFKQLLKLSAKNEITGSGIFDAEILAICLSNGVTEFYTLDRKFPTDDSVKLVNPTV